MTTILLVPMAARASMQGPASRIRKLAQAFARRGHDAVVAAPNDGNWSSVPDVREAAFEAPIPLGLPPAIGKGAFERATKLGMPGRVAVKSFEQVQFMTGALSYRYLVASIEQLRGIIRSQRPRAVYTEFNLSAIVAAKAEGVPVFGTHSFPAQASFASSPQFARGMRHVLRELGQKEITSALELFERLDKRFVASIVELEPFAPESGVEFVGTFDVADGATSGAVSDAARAQDVSSLSAGPDVILSPASTSSTTASPPNAAASPATVTAAPLATRDSILVYLGSGSVRAKQIVEVLRVAFADESHAVHVGGMSDPGTLPPHIHVAPRIDFASLFPRTSLFINHGGQNSMVDGLLHGIPQICVPGKVFERQYNAESVTRAGAGLRLDAFDASHLREAARTLLDDSSYARKAAELGNHLREAGGVDAIVSSVERHL